MQQKFLMSILAVLLAGLAGSAGAQEGQHWVASWATSPAAYFVYAPPVVPVAPNAYAPATIQPDLAFPFPDTDHDQAANQTFRSIVKPDLWGNQMRFRFSNVFGNAAITIAPGQEIWSDATALPFIHGADDPAIQGRNLAVSYSVKGASGVMTYHAASNQTSYISAPGSGDRTMDADVFAYEFTTTSWFFLDAVDVMAPAGTVVICAFGDSITDGTHTTLNENDRWMNGLSRRLHNAYGDRVSIVNEAIGGNRVVNPAVVNATSGPAATDRLDRDVLGLSGLTHVIWLEGINDLGASHTTDAVIAGYKNVVTRLHAKGIKVYAGTLTSALGMVNPAEGWNPDRVATGDNGPRVDQDRKTINTFIRASGLFDGVEDFDAATLDPATGNMKAEFVPNSQMTELPWDYLHPNHAGYLAMAGAVNIAPFRPR